MPLQYRTPALDDGAFGNTYLRWTVLYAFLVLVIATLPLWLSPIIPQHVCWINALGTVVFGLAWVLIAMRAVLNYVRLLKQPTISLEALDVARTRIFRHIVVVPCYLDPLEMLFDCLGTLLMQPDPKKLIVVVAFEKKTPDLPEKVAAVRRSFGGRFGELLLSIHTIDREREIPGGCSNKNFALHQAHQHVTLHHSDYQKTAYTVTTCDTDSLFYPEYFSALEACYNNANPIVNVDGTRPVKLCVWQPPMFYNWDLDGRPFFVRVTGIMRSMMMLGGLIAFNLNPMSIFSYPLELGLEAGFINPRYSVDDIIFKVRCMCSANQTIPVLLLPVPVISGPTNGTTYVEEISEWAKQLRRWIIGSSESFHYCITHWRGKPFGSALHWFFMFFVYYAVLLCSAGVFNIFVAVPLPWVHYAKIYSFSLRYIGLLGLLMQYVVFVVAFTLDRLAVSRMTVKENINPLRNLAHLIVAPVVLTAYSVIAFQAIMKFVFVGKRMAGHVMAAKEGLRVATDARSAQNQLIEDGQQPADLHQEQDEQLPLDRAPSFSLSTSFTRPEMSGSQPRMSSSFQTQESSPQRTPTPGHSPVQSDQPAPVAVPVSFRSTDSNALAGLPDYFYFGEFAFDPRSVSSSQGSVFSYP